MAEEGKWRGFTQPTHPQPAHQNTEGGLILPTEDYVLIKKTGKNYEVISNLDFTVIADEE